MATDSSMPETEIHEEIGRRTIQISDLKEELWDLRDRIDETDHRSDSLVQGLTSKANEISLRKSKANELEDKVALLEGKGEEHARSLRKAAADAAEELNRVKEQLRQIDEASSSTVARSRAERQRSELLHAEGSSLRAKIEASSRQLAHERDQLEQDEAAEAARQARAEKAFEQQEAERREDESKQLAVAVDAVASAKTQVLRLEKALAMERDSANGLRASMEKRQQRRDLEEEEVDALEAELTALSMQAEFRGLEDELARSRRDCQRMAQEVANYKSESAFKKQSLQGALDETKRMLSDHLESTQAAPTDPGLEVLINALAEAKSRAAEQQAVVARLELRCNSLQAEVDAESDASETSQLAPTDQQRQHTDLTLELRAAEQSLRAASRQADDRAVAAVRAEAKVMEAERLARQKEALLRCKLHELWSWLRHVN